MSETWTIGELAERAAALLGREPPAGRRGLDGSGARVDGRVREVPNERLIRWYTTIGLLDPPLGRRGRVALYGRRHLLQLVAVKRRQADGRSIADIQAELAGATDAMLQRVAGLTEPAPRPLAPRSQAEVKHPSGAPPAPSATGRGGPGPDADAEPAVPDTARPPARDRFWAYPAARTGGTPAAAGHHVTSEPPGSPPVPGASPEGLLPVAAPSREAARSPAPEVAPYAGALRPAAAWRETGYGEDDAREDTSPPDRVPAGRRDAAQTSGTGGGHTGTARQDTAHPDIGHTETTHAHAAHPDLVHGIRLAPGVTILLDHAHRAPDGREATALRRAAAPLLTALATLGLAGPFGDAREAHHTRDGQAGDHASAGGMTS